jgi:hypothetical protein
MAKAGNNIRRLAWKRKIRAMKMYAASGVFIFTPIPIYSLLGLTRISVIFHLFCWILGTFMLRKGHKITEAANRADQGAVAEESTALILSELERDGWSIEFNIPLRYWGDADAFLSSPKNNYYVVDTKSNKGTVFFDGTRLMLRYGSKIYPFSKDILSALRGQAVSLKELKGLRFVTPVICFSNATIDLPTIVIEKVYVLDHRSLVSTLKKIDENIK